MEMSFSAMSRRREGRVRYVDLHPDDAIGTQCQNADAKESSPQVAVKYRTGSDSDRTQLAQRPSCVNQKTIGNAPLVEVVAGTKYTLAVVLRSLSAVATAP